MAKNPPQESFPPVKQNTPIPIGCPKGGFKEKKNGTRPKMEAIRTLYKKIKAMRRGHGYEMGKATNSGMTKVQSALRSFGFDK